MDPFTRRLFVKHRTEFTYAGSARESVNEIRLGPRDGPRQRIEYARLSVTPTADVAESIDSWGNLVWWCQVVDPHERLIIESESSVVTTGATPLAAVDDVPDSWAAVGSDGYRDELAEFLPPSELVTWSFETQRFLDALAVPPGRGVAVWAADLAVALNASLIYERGATDVTTAVDGVIASGRGVCQDFAHVFIALCRLNGVAARYVSGWMYEAAREGPVESHAWAEINIPGVGWVEEDPTHVGEVSDRYVRIACGRDYADVVPIKGTYLGGLTESMRVTVDLRDLDASLVV